MGKIGSSRKGINLGEKNGQWKGDKVSYGALHDWIKSRLRKPEVCENCHIKPPYDLCNRSRKYKRDLGDWEWLCRTCHMIKDGRLNKLHTNNIGRHHSEETKRKIGSSSKGRSAWNKGLKYHNKRTTQVI